VRAARTIAAAACACAFTAAAARQQTPVFRTGVDVVLVDVSVRQGGRVL